MAGTSDSRQGGKTDTAELRAATLQNLNNEALRRGEHLLAGIIETSPASIVLIDRSRHIVFANARAEQVLGLKLRDLAKRTYDDPAWHITRFDGTPLSQDELPFERVRASGEAVYGIEHAILREDGERRLLRINAAPLFDPGGQFESMVAHIEDVTERQRAQEALRLTQYAIDRAVDAIFWINQEGRIVYANDVACRSLGYTRKELLSRTVHDVDPDYPETEWPEQWRRLKQRGSSFVESHHRTKDGRVFPVQIGANFLAYKGREYNIVFARDISEQKRAEAALRAAEQEWRNIFQAVGSPALILDADHRVLTANRASLAAADMSEDDIQGRPCYEVFHRTDRPPPHCPMERLLGSKTYETEPMEMEVLGRTHLVSCTPIFSDQGRLERIIHIATDITRQKELEAQLRQAEKMEAIGQLAGGVAHDFNNQLAGVMGYADLLHSRLEDPALRRFAESIIVSATRAEDLTEQLLAFARKGHFQESKVDLHETIREVVEMLAHSIDRRIRLQQVLGARSAVTRGDATQLQNALLNLALNARDAMPEGGKLTFSTDVRTLGPAFCEAQPFDMAPGEYIELQVRDTGSGIPADVRAHMFEPFFTTKKPGQGTGMGLAAVYGTVTQHKGAIRVGSQEGEGTTFTLYLPLKAAADPEIQADEEIRPASGSARILMADDEKAIRTIGAEMLGELGYRVTQVSDGREAVEHYRTHWREIDLVILDIVMPEMNGTEAFHALREINPDARILICSGYSIDGEARTLMERGAAGFVPKPFRTKALAQAVDRAIRSP